MNAFDTLQEPARPFLDPEALKSKFLKLSAPVHPDRVHHLSEDEKQEATQKFSTLNAAYVQLREPRDRINILLEHETGAKPRDIQKIPPGTMDLFVEVGQHCRDVDAYLAARDLSENSPLLKVAAMLKKKEWQSKQELIQAKVHAKAEESLAELQKLDAEWVQCEDHKALLLRLENLGRTFSYLSRWNQQLTERALQLQIG